MTAERYNLAACAFILAVLFGFGQVILDLPAMQ